MVTSSVNNNVTSNVTNSGKVKWQEALTDAQTGLEKAQKDVSQWKAAVAVIRRKIEVGDLGRENGNQRLRGYAQVNRHRSDQQHSDLRHYRPVEVRGHPGLDFAVEESRWPVTISVN